MAVNACEVENVRPYESPIKVLFKAWCYAALDKYFGKCALISSVSIDKKPFV